MKKLFLSMMLLALPILASAYDCQVDGIYYQLTSGNQAEVTYESTNYNSYSGEVVIPEKFTYNGVEYSVTSIGNRAFSKCSGLTSVTIPSSVTSIGSCAFDGSYGLISVHITDLAAWCNIDFTDWYSNPLNYANHLYIDNTELLDVVIPEGVTAIKQYAFQGGSGLTSVTIPNSVTNIERYAFSHCTGLTSVTIPNSVTSIGYEAFYNCRSLNSLTIPNSVTTIGSSAFYCCSSLTSISIPNSVTSIGSSAFEKCSGLTSVTIPNSVTTIGWGAFFDCSRLTSVHITDLESWCKIEFGYYDSNPLAYAHHLYLNGEKIRKLEIPNTVTGIGNYAFYGCNAIVSVTIPNSVTTIERYAFSHCSGLTSVTIPNSVTSIGGAAFYGCSGLTSVDIPNSVTSIGSSAFQNCSGLTSVTIPNSVTTIGGGAFKDCTGLTSVTIPNSVTSILDAAFFDCSGLTSVTIPNSVTSIGNYAFSYCTSLTSVTIPNFVTSIGNQAFAECSKLEEVHCLAEKVPSTSTNAFEKSYSEYMTLYVPAGSLNAYKSTEPWSQFGTIKAIGGSGEEPTKCATPTISYADKTLTFACETEGVEYVYEIKDADIKKGYDATVDLTATYEISVYATKAGYENSDIATATLVWTDAIFTETTPETPTSAKAVQESIPVLISAKSGNISVRCEADGQEVNVYTIDGLSLGTATVKNGEALISTSIPSGDIAVVKVGGRSVKVIMR